MQFTLSGFSQAEAVRLGLSGDDLYLLRWFVNFKNSGKMVFKIINGEKYLYNKNESPHKTIDTKLGINDIVITKLKKRRNTTLIIGENFTPSSVIFVDNNPIKTDFIDENTLSVSNKDVNNYEEIIVGQRAANMTVLGYSSPYINKK